MWWAVEPKDRWPADEATRVRIDKGWHKLWGDRSQEIVFIGTKGMDQAAIKARLDASLMELPKEGRVDTKEWLKLPDPFPSWRRE